MIRYSLLVAASFISLASCVHAGDFAYSPSQPMEPIPSGWRQIFLDQFNGLYLAHGTSSGYEPFYPWGARSNNNEIEYYADPRPGGDAPEIQSLTPFTTTNGLLTIRAMPIPPAVQSKAGGYAYASGLLQTARSLSFTYGYVEMRARLPHGRGFWPAFWLVPTDLSWPPEIDVMESLGDDTHAYYVTVHSSVVGDPDIGISTRITMAADMANGFHVYGVKWTADEIAFYFDRRRLASVPTPSDMHKPMYLILNLAVGGWAGPPNATTRFPGEFVVDWIRVYSPSNR